MATFDVIAVGAGPAGSTAARLLAESGLKVLLLDRAQFPRDKPCGGGVTHRARALMPRGFSDVVEQEVYEARFSYKHRPSFSYSSPDPLAYMTQRRLLDAFLASRAETAGAIFKDGVRVIGVQQADGGCEVTSQRESWTARVVIGADGANGIVARSIGLEPSAGAWVALEGNTADARRVGQWRRSIGFDFGSVPGGYGWLFAKGDHVNIGAGGWRRNGPDLRRKLEAVCRHYGVRAESLCNVRGHSLPIRRIGSPLVKGNVLLTGDAAALVDPLSGEGIHSALLSANLAAKAVIEHLDQGSQVAGYQERLEQELGAELEMSRHLQKLFHRTPGLYLSILKRSPWIWRKLAAFCRGGESYNSLRGSFGPFGTLAAGLARVVPEESA